MVMMMIMMVMIDGKKFRYVSCTPRVLFPTLRPVCVPVFLFRRTMKPVGDFQSNAAINVD